MTHRSRTSLPSTDVKGGVERLHYEALSIARHLRAKLDDVMFKRTVRDLVNISNTVDDHGYTLIPSVQVELLWAMGYPGPNGYRLHRLQFAVIE